MIKCIYKVKIEYPAFFFVVYSEISDFFNTVLYISLMQCNIFS